MLLTKRVALRKCLEFQGRKMCLVSGSANLGLAEKVAGKLGLGVLDMVRQKFKCGESMVRITDLDCHIKRHDVYVFQGVDDHVNDNLIELALIQDTLGRAGASEVRVVLPYMPYSRQDKRKKMNGSCLIEPVSVGVVARMLNAGTIHGLTSVDFHSDQIELAFGNTPVTHLSAQSLLINHFRHFEGREDVVVVSPDAGRDKFCQEVADDLKLRMITMQKVRPADNEAKIISDLDSLKGKTVLMFDDMCDTGGTVRAAKAKINEAGCTAVYFAATHGILSGPGVENLREAGFEEVVFTDTVSIPDEKRVGFDALTVISVSDMLADSIIQEFRGQA